MPLDPSEGKVHWKVTIRKSTAARLARFLHDPSYQTFAYGSRSALVNQLLENHIDEMEKKYGKPTERELNDLGGNEEVAINDL